MGCSKKNRRILNVLLLYLIIFVVSFVIVCMQYKYNSGFKCVVHALFGIDCPGCGATRMAISILQLDFYQAFRYNTFMFLTLPFVMIIVLIQSYYYIVKNMILKYLDKLVIVYSILMLIFGIIRNISIFSWLKPTVI